MFPKFTSCLSFLLLLGTVTGFAREDLPGDWRARETHGLGFGLIEAHYGDGVQVFYDYTPAAFLQFHFSAYQTEIHSPVETLEESVDTQSSGISLSARWFPGRAAGFFGGLGGARSSVSQRIPPEMLPGQPEPGETIESSGEYAFALVEFGWQGWEGYYFTVSSARGMTTILREQDNTRDIADAEVRERARYGLGSARFFFALNLGFGWHF